MGGAVSVSWHDSSDSLIGDGKKSVVSDPIQVAGFTAEKYWAANEKLFLTRAIVGYEKAYEAKTLPDGGLLSISTYPSASPGSPDLTTYLTMHVDKATNTCLSKSYLTDKSLDEKNCAATSVFKIHSDPVRFEFWTDEHAGRRSGPMLVPIVVEALGKLGSKATVMPDQKSPSTPGALSILTTPIDDCSVTAENFLEFIKATMKETGATEEEDGTLREVTTSWFAPTSHRLHTLDGAANALVSREFGGDSSCKNLYGVGTLKALHDPFRLEFWVDSVEARRAGPGQMEIISGVVKEVLKSLD